MLAARAQQVASSSALARPAGGGVAGGVASTDQVGAVPVAVSANVAMTAATGVLIVRGPTAAPGLYCVGCLPCGCYVFFRFCGNKSRRRCLLMSA